jgi:hypothetical protein
VGERNKRTDTAGTMADTGGDRTPRALAAAEEPEEEVSVSIRMRETFNYILSNKSFLVFIYKDGFDDEAEGSGIFSKEFGS